MSYKTREYLKRKFLALEKPKQQDFYDWIDAFVHRDDSGINLKFLDTTSQQLKTSVALDATSASITLGSGGKEGNLYLRNAAGDLKSALYGPNLYLGGGPGDSIFSVDCGSGQLKIGGHGKQAQITLIDFQNKVTSEWLGSLGQLYLGGDRNGARILLDGSNGSLKLGDDITTPKIYIDGSNGSLKLGDDITNPKIYINGSNGSLKLGGDSTNPKISLDGKNEEIVLKNSSGNTTARWHSSNGRLYLGGDIGNAKIFLDGLEGFLILGGHGKQPQITLIDFQNKVTSEWLGSLGRLYLGGDRNGARILLDGSNGSLKLGGDSTNPKISLDGSNGSLKLGGDSTNPKIFLDSKNEEIILKNSSGKITSQWSGSYGRLYLGGDIENAKIFLDGLEGFLTLGGHGKQSKITLINNQNKITAEWFGSLGKLFLGGDSNNSTIELDGSTGNIYAKAVIPPDFVFAKGYSIDSIEAVNHFIQKHKHLPEIPSAQEIKETGLNLTDFSMKLLQKIEELTLYVIDLQNQINELKPTK